MRYMIAVLACLSLANQSAAVSPDDRAIVAGAVVAGGTYFALHEFATESKSSFSSRTGNRYSQQQMIGISLGAGLATYAVVLVFSLPVNSAVIDVDRGARLRLPVPSLDVRGRVHLPLLRWRF